MHAAGFRVWMLRAHPGTKSARRVREQHKAVDDSRQGPRRRRFRNEMVYDGLVTSRFPAAAGYRWTRPMLRLFRYFLPREERFFDLFARHSQTVVQGAE